MRNIKKLILVILILNISIYLNLAIAQGHIIKGVQQVKFGFLFDRYEFGLNGGYYYYLDKRSNIGGEFELKYGNIGLTNIKTINLNQTYSRYFFNYGYRTQKYLHTNYYLGAIENLGVGLEVSRSKIKNENDTYNSMTKPTASLGLGVINEFYFEHWGIDFIMEQRGVLNSFLGHRFWLFRVGVKRNF